DGQGHWRSGRPGRRDRAGRGRSNPGPPGGRHGRGPCQGGPRPPPRGRPHRRSQRLQGGRPLGDRTYAGDRLHQPHRKGPARLMTVVDSPSPIVVEVRPAYLAARQALVALLQRDLLVLRKNLTEFVTRTLVQPFLLVFVFLYVFPTIGQGIGAAPRAGQTAVQ